MMNFLTEHQKRNADNLGSPLSGHSFAAPEHLTEEIRTLRYHKLRFISAIHKKN